MSCKEGTDIQTYFKIVLIITERRVTLHTECNPGESLESSEAQDLCAGCRLLKIFFFGRKRITVNKWSHALGK